MFDDHRRICCQSQDSAGKRTIRDHILMIRKILEKYQEIIFSQKTQEARRRIREEPGGAHVPGWRGLTPGRASPV
jgi:hypothetical protein